MKEASAIFCLFILISCSKSGNGEKDNELPVVTITAPVDGQVYTGGQSAIVTAHLTDNQRIVEVHVHVSDLNSGTLLIDIHRNPGVSDYSLNESFVVPAGVQYKVLILAKDNSANEGHASVNISSN